MLTNTGLVAHAISKIGIGYMYGFTGIVTEAIIQQKAIQYSRVYTATYIQKCRALIGRYVTDCSGLIDMYLGIDYNAKRYYNDATNKGPIGTIPKTIPGILVFKYDYDGSIGHVGISAGDGTVIEAKGIDYGVVRTQLANNGWDLWAYCHLISYTTQEENMLQKGSKGEAVKAWQISLIKCGYSVGTAGDDGNFGSNTLAGTNAFKAAAGLDQNGIVDDICWGKMALTLIALPGDISGIKEELATIKNELSNAKMTIEVSQGTINDLNTKYDEVCSGLQILRKHPR